MLCAFSIQMYGKGETDFASENRKKKIVLDEKEKRKFQYFFLEALRQKAAGQRDAAADNLIRSHYIDPGNATVLSELANLNISLGRIGLARRYMREAVALEPENYWLKQALAQLYIQNKEYKLAAETFESILKDNPEKKEFNYILASLYTQIQQPEKAIKAWDNLEEEVGLNEQISLEKFKLYLSMGKEKKAFNEIDRLIKAFPKDTRYRVLKGDLYVALENDKKAEENYKKILKSFPDDYLASNQLGLLYISQQKIDEGVQLLTGVLKNKEAEFELKRAILSFFSQDSILTSKIDDSVYQEVINSHPNEEIPYLMYATYLLDRNRPEGFEYIRQALEINPQYEDSWGLLINYHASQNDTIGLINATQEAIEHFPENSDFYYILGTAARMQKNWDLALHAWKKSLSLVKDRNAALSSIIMGQIGDIYIEMDKKQEAYLAYDTALIYNENNLLVLNNYAYFLSLDGKNLDKAERMSGKTVQADPKSPVFLDTYAWIYFKQGNYTLALLYIQQAYNNGGNGDAEVLEHYGDILYKTGDKEKARSMWKSAWEISEKKNSENSILKKKNETGEYIEK
jgi:tetratricopeptide (TPR) repeat protein